MTAKTKHVWIVEVRRGNSIAATVEGTHVSWSSKNVVAAFETRKEALDFRDHLYNWEDECTLLVTKYLRML